MIAALRRWRWQRQRNRLAEAAESRWQEWLAQEIPGNAHRFSDTSWLVIDTETTGLDDDATLVSIGWVAIREGRIRLGEAEHHLLATTSDVGHSATVHRLTDSDLEAGRAPTEVLHALATALVDHWPVFHGAALDVRLLDAAFQQAGAGGFPPPWVDTLQAEKHRRARREAPLKPGDLQLDALRQHYRLPAHTQHHALSDALATAELFCAQAMANGQRSQPELAELWAR